MPEPIDIKKLPLVELQSLCYEQIKLLQKTQAIINALDEEIELRKQEPKNEKTAETSA